MAHEVTLNHCSAVTTLESGRNTHTILLVGDDPFIKEHITKLPANYSFVEITKESDILEQTRSHMPALLIYDPGASGGNGYKTLHALKADETLNHIPVISLTDDACGETRQEALEAGADDYLPRPFSSKELQVKINNLLKFHIQEIALKQINRQLERKIEEQLDIIEKNKRLTKFFPGNLVKWILSGEHIVELHSQRKRLTVFFSDLAGFTELADRTPPEQVRNLLNEYFTEMVHIVDRYEGTLDKFIGDGLMVFFGAPEPMDEKIQAIRAVSMAVDMQMRMKVLARQWYEQGIHHNIDIRMGIHQEHVMVGNFGSRQVMEYTVFGSGVNLASRLESYCEPRKILVSLPVYSHTVELFPYSPVVEQIFRGFERLVPVSELDPEKLSHFPTKAITEFLTAPL